eukprot:CAMPEP_0203946828 /NCGR_PEP_ID=MMETSP0359-20131031/81964_1 /ASSEMBLY_ACC=CAM_ASM_000338 /TAXON_ID=268821 /ORGANISM="Scrippsiella Hangoei, Strain SHTV-5" /LENGTH=224 /DNA_ID=CAMNT_0050878173 /DNA_START=75 /DNA_END=749 /DNA_ORIENTATION=+
MAPSRFAMAAAATAAVGFINVATTHATAFLAPSAAVARPSAVGPAQTGESASSQGWGATVAAVTVGAHVGLVVAASYGRRSVARRAESTPATTYMESAADERLFEQVYLDYATEYLKGPMYHNDLKVQGFLPEYPGDPMFKQGKMTSNVVGNLKTFSSNELAFFAVLFFAIGLYGTLMFWWFDPQFLRADLTGQINPSYVIEALFLPVSFFMHIACYIQRKNGK